MFDVLLLVTVVLNIHVCKGLMDMLTVTIQALYLNNTMRQGIVDVFAVC